MPGRHWQLVVFTILAQLAVGLTLVLALGLQLVAGHRKSLESVMLTGAVLDLVVLILGVAVVMSATHLGSMAGALGAFANLRQSWLSRESPGTWC